MATTTNFGWETPDDTDLVKDGALAMRTLGNGIDTSFVDLKGGTTGQNLRKATNTDLDFTWAGDATNTVIDAEGDLLVGDSADTLQRLAIGTTGQVLTVDTAIDGKIKWAAAAGGGKVLQVVSNTNNTEVLIQTGTYTDTGITATITPTASNSKILVLVSANIGIQNSSVTDIWADLRLLRGASAIQTWGDNAGGGMFMRIGGASGTLRLVGNYAITYLDSPATTSSTTYKVQGSRQGTADIYCQRGGVAPSTITLLEIGA